MKTDNDVQVVGTLWLQRVTEDDGIAVVNLEAEFDELPPDVICPALEKYITILGEILDHYEAMYLATSQGDFSPTSRQMN